MGKQLKKKEEVGMSRFHLFASTDIQSKKSLHGYAQKPIFSVFSTLTLNSLNGHTQNLPIYFYINFKDHCLPFLKDPYIILDYREESINVFLEEVPDVDLMLQ